MQFMEGGWLAVSSPSWFLLNAVGKELMQDTFGLPLYLRAAVVCCNTCLIRRRACKATNIKIRIHD
jgi:hypothetical protein